jgi:hypothetical protein
LGSSSLLVDFLGARGDFNFSITDEKKNTLIIRKISSKNRMAVSVMIIAK